MKENTILKLILTLGTLFVLISINYMHPSSQIISPSIPSIHTQTISEDFNHYR